MVLSGKLVGGHFYKLYSKILNFYRYPANPIARFIQQTPTVRSPVYIFQLPLPQNELYL